MRLHTGEKDYHFDKISRLTTNIHATHVCLAFVEGGIEVWEIDDEHRTESVAQVAAYYKASQTSCNWIMVAENTGFRNPTTPYADQDPDLYIG